MKGFLISAAVALGLLGASVSTAGTALASGQDDHRRDGGYSLNKYFGALLYGQPHHYSRQGYRQGYRNDDRRGYRDGQRHGYSKRYTYKPKRHADRQGRRDYRAARPCYATSKVGFDDHGRRARIGGTMCYNAYGTPYIVRGSRHIIHYY